MRLWFYSTIVVFFSVFMADHSYAILDADDPRLESLPEAVREANTITMPAEKKTMKLIFQNRYGNFIVFYDYSGRPLYLQYRIDRWDYRNDDVVKHLRRGLPYRIQFDYIGETVEAPKHDTKNIKQFFDENKDAPERLIRQVDRVHIGVFLILRQAVSDDIRF